MKKLNNITELSEILATAVAARPDLSERISSLLGDPQKRVQPGKGEKDLSQLQRKENARRMFTRQHLNQQLKATA